MLFTFTGPSLAHPMAPVLITVIQLNATEHLVVWSFSRGEGAVDPDRLSLAFNTDCKLSGPALLRQAADRWLREERYRCEPGQGEPRAINVHGLRQLATSVAVRVVDAEKNEQIYLLDEPSTTLPFSPSVTGRTVFSQYLVFGGMHILEGVDHLLFLVALCFLVGGALKSLIGLVTAFTVAHSITLSAAALGWFNLPVRPVEAMIALSIALLAADLIKNRRRLQKRVLQYWPVVFVFGLLHGLGFAGALAEFGLPDKAMMSALLAFNLGIELGQIGFVLMCAVVIRHVTKVWESGWLNHAVGVGIGCTAGFWFVARII